MDQNKQYIDGLLYAYKLMEHYTKAGIYMIPITGIMDKVLNEIRSQSKLDLSDIDISPPLWHRPQD